MSKVKIIVISVVTVVFIYLVVCVTDFLLVISGGKPVFCVRDTEENYYGLGYSYVTHFHSITGESEYAVYILGNPVYSTFTN